MVVFKRKQIIVLALILMIIVAGYLQYSYKQGSESAGRDNDRLGEAVYVDSENDKEKISDGLIDKEINDKAVSNNELSASKAANDFFVQAKIDKEMSRSKSNDSLKVISDDEGASKEARADAYNKIMELVNNSDREMRIETLIKEKGFSDAVAIFADDGSIDIIVKTASLTAAQTAQIADIVSRQGKMAIDKIHIRNMF